MKIVATADLHGNLPKIPECDLLLIGGDVCPTTDHKLQFQSKWMKEVFKSWLREVPAYEIVWIGGNHDFILQELDFAKIDNIGGTYLDGTEHRTASGLKVWGSPLSPTFGKWAFMRDDAGLAAEWEKIPNDVDILMVHGPMYGIGDEVDNDWHPRDPHVGSKTLRNRIGYGDFPNLKLFITGHIHEGYGWDEVEIGNNKFTYANVSHVNSAYNPVNPPMVFNL